MRKRIIALVVILFLVFNINLAYAHSPIEKMLPQAEAVLEKGPKQIELWFEDPVEVFQGSIIVSSEQNEIMSLEKPKLDPHDKRHVTAALPKDLSPGNYSVKIDAISFDGHQVKENYQFEVKQPVLSKEELFQKFKLEKSNPEDGGIVSTSPEEIELWFNDKTAVTVFGVFNDQGKTIATGDSFQDPSNPKHFTIKIKKPLHKGTYSAHWYATVGDSEKNGIFYFAVQE
jgi:methionine-rich copper-binding protein CopC